MLPLAPPPVAAQPQANLPRRFAASRQGVAASLREGLRRTSAPRYTLTVPMTVLSIVRAVALLAAAACAEAQSQRSIVGIATDSSGKAIEGATVRFRPDAHPDIPSLTEVTPPAAWRDAATDRRGMFRIASAQPGMLFVTTEAGLGGVALRAWPGRAAALRLSPMAEVSNAEGGEIEVFAAARLESGDGTERRLLPVMRGESVRMPEGEYELWWLSGRGASWQKVSLRSGQHKQLQALQASEPVPDLGHRLSPSGFPHLDLRGATALLGKAAKATLLPHAAAAETEWFSLRMVDAPEGARCALLHGGNGFRVHTNAEPVDGTVRLPSLLRTGNDWIVAHAPGRAAQALRLANAEKLGEVRFAGDRTVACEVIGPDGAPAADAVITFRPEFYGPITARAFCDELGNARLGPIAGAGIVCVEGESHLPFQASLAEGDAAPIAIRLEEGLRAQGVVRFADGSPASSIVVTLRDRTGRMLPPTRTCVSSNDGSFSFAGLDDSMRWVAFASMTRDGKTFSAQFVARGGGDPIVLVLEDEDPKLIRDDR